MLLRGESRWRRRVCAVGLSSTVIGCIGLAGSAGAATVRHYEQVSPPDKGLGDIVGDGITTVAAASGEAAAFNSRAQFAGAVGSGVSGQTQYVARRTANGWRTQAVTPMPRPDAVQTFFASTKLQVYSTDLNTALLWAYDLPASNADTPDSNNIYVEDTATRALQSLTVSQQDPLSPFDFLTATVRGVSDDARHVAFLTDTRLLPDAVGATNLYQWDNGTLTVADVLPDGRVSPGGANVYPPDYRGAMSADGSRLAFTAPASGSDAQLYQRIDGSRTVWISEPETRAWRDRTDTTLPTGVILQGGSQDGNTVFFVTDSALLDSDTNGGPDLYRYTDSADPANDSNLTLISQNGDAPGDNLGAALVGFSTDAQRVYYHTVSDTIVLWDHGNQHLVLSGVTRRTFPSNQFTVTASAPGLGRVTPDGAYMVFVSDQTTDGVHGLTGDVTNGHSQMYVYSRRTDTVTCVSCPPTGATSEATVVPSVTAGNPTIANVAVRPQFLSDAGQAFFSTADALVPQDTNGVDDTYEYDGPTGTLSLISTGKGRSPAMFGDASASGNDVFIVTRQSLVSSDSDQLVDLYDARVGPALPEPDTHETLPCVGEACQSPPSAAPAEDGLGSLTLEDGGQSPLAPAKVLVARRVVTFQGTSGSLGVRLLAPGTLKWRGRGLRSDSQKRRRVGTAHLTVQLTRTARARLRRTGVYRTTLHVMLLQAGGAEVGAATHLTFRTTAKKGR